MIRMIGLILFALDIILIPLYIAYYIILSIHLMYACATTKGNFKKEFADFNEIFINDIKSRLKIHKERIFGA